MLGCYLIKLNAKETCTRDVMRLIHPCAVRLARARCSRERRSILVHYMVPMRMMMCRSWQQFLQIPGPTIQMYTYAYVCTCMHMYLHAYVHTCICIHMHIRSLDFEELDIWLLNYFVECYTPMVACHPRTQCTCVICVL